MKSYKKIALAFAILFCFTAGCWALEANGYIITLNSDTIYGKIQLTRFNQTTGAFILNGIEEESFYTKVVFCPKGSKSYKAYFPEMLSGFGFLYKSKPYAYQQAIIQHKSIFKSGNYQTRFVHILYNDSIGSVTKDLHFVPNPVLQSSTDKYLKYNSYIFRLKNIAGKPDTLRIQQQ
jgi:hypothetical protein